MSCRGAALCLLAACGRLGFAPVDDAPVDDAPVDSPDCPSTYTVELPSSTSRYRVISTNELPRVHHGACKADSAGATHLVVIDDPIEQVELDSVLKTVPAPTFNRFYVGLVQTPGQTDFATSWFWLTGSELDPQLWRANEPDDLDLVEDGTEQLAVMDFSGRLVDVSGGSPYGGVCECDGLAIDPDVEVGLP